MQLKRIRNMDDKMIREKVEKLKAGNVRAVAAETKYIRPYSGMIVKTIYNLTEEKFTNYSFAQQGSRYARVRPWHGEIQIIFDRSMTIKEIKETLHAAAEETLNNLSIFFEINKNYY